MAEAEMDAVLQSEPDHVSAYMLRGIPFGNRQLLPPQRQWADVLSSVKYGIPTYVDDWFYCKYR